MKRNLYVALIVIGALVLILWSGYQNYERRKLERELQAHGIHIPGGKNNMSVEQDVAADEGLPNLRGKQAPSFTLHDLEGRRVSLSDYKGKAVLVNFWATWCAPCKIEIPWLIALRKQYGPQGFEILGISEDDPGTSRETIAKFSQKEGIDYPVLIGDDAVSRKYGGVEFLPTSFFVGRDGKVVAETAGLATQDEVEANIRKALAAKEK